MCKKIETMKKIVLITFATLLLSSLSAIAQTTNPVSTARIVGMDGRAELVFDEPITEGFTVEVRDLTGKVMFSARHLAEDEPCESVELAVESLRKGIYMVQVVSSSGKTKTLKLQRN